MTIILNTFRDKKFWGGWVFDDRGKGAAKRRIHNITDGKQTADIEATADW